MLKIMLVISIVWSTMISIDWNGMYCNIIGNSNDAIFNPCVFVFIIIACLHRRLLIIMWAGSETFYHYGRHWYLLNAITILLQFKLGISSHLPHLICCNISHTQNAFQISFEKHTPYISFLFLIIQYFIAATAASITVASLLFCALEKCMQGFIFIASEFSNHYINLFYVRKLYNI